MTLAHILGFLCGACIAIALTVYAFYVRERAPSRYKGLMRYVAPPNRTPKVAATLLVAIMLGWLIGGVVAYFVFLSHSFPQVFFIDMLLVIVVALAISVSVLVTRRRGSALR